MSANSDDKLPEESSTSGVSNNDPPQSESTSEDVGDEPAEDGSSKDELDELITGPQSESDLADALISGIIIVASILFYIESLEFGDQSLGSEDPGVAFWPQIVLIIIILFASLNLGFIVWRNREELRFDKDAVSELLESLRPGGIDTETRQFGVAIVLTGLYLAVLTDLGYLLATAAFLALFLWNLEYRAIVKNVIFSIVITLFTFILFSNFMNIALPFGSGPFRELAIFIDSLI